MQSCETRECMKYWMKPITRSMATAATGSALLWAGIVTRWTTEHELATSIIFSASMPFLLASGIYAAIAAVRLGKPLESTYRKEQPKEGRTPR